MLIWLKLIDLEYRNLFKKMFMAEYKVLFNNNKIYLFEQTAKYLYKVHQIFHSSLTTKSL